ncbi:unnamed protein product [Dicrocoelium dendriticum]|nr:unnamed protein product [Dicrocoelium dendriticum]
MFDKEFNAAALAAHNDYRAAHGCPELELDAKLAEDSQQYAVKLAREGQLKHSECGDYGENLATEGSSGKAELSDIDHQVDDQKALLEAFRCEVLHTHNRYRAKHGHPCLKRSVTLDSMALSWARQLRKSGQPAYSNLTYANQLMGENVSDRCTVNGRLSGQTLVEKWYKEGETYNYLSEPDSVEHVGHFTQLLWRETKELGIGFVPSDTPDRAFIVCFYHPPGNVKGQFLVNISPPIVWE